MRNQSYITLCTLNLVYVLYNYNYIQKCNGIYRFTIIYSIFNYVLHVLETVV